ncbi:hypothetical protein RI367_001060 [Sorochytrium milnesiophthora]
MFVQLLVLAATVLPLINSVNGACSPSNLRIRKEVRDMNATEWSRYAAAVQKLNTLPAVRDQYKGLSRREEFAAIHVDNWTTPHSDPRFLPWHRLFLREYENALRAIDPTVAIPYWGWDQDANHPEQSAVLTSKYYGSSSPGQCIPDGPFKFSSKVGDDGDVGAGHCVCRGFNPRTTSKRLTSTAELAQLMKQVTTHSQFSYGFEFGGHAVVHIYIGQIDRTQNWCDMGVMYSPNDVLFFAHHAFIDKVWRDFQAAHPGVPFDGQTYVQHNLITRTASLADPLTPFVKPDGSNYTVADTFDNNNADAQCEIYIPRGGVVPKQPVLRAGPGRVAPAPATPVLAPLPGTLPPATQFNNVLITLPGSNVTVPAPEAGRQLVAIPKSWADHMHVSMDVIEDANQLWRDVNTNVQVKMAQNNLADLEYPHAPVPASVLRMLNH